MSRSAYISAYLWLTEKVDTFFLEVFFIQISTAAIIQVAEIIVATFILLPCTVLFIEVLVAYWQHPFNNDDTTKTFKGQQSRVILMPAHNEAMVIESAISTVKSQMYSTDRLVIIADNCTDATASIAERCGANVIERKNEQQLGKGYALDFGIRYLKQDAPDIVIMVDADCKIQPGALDKISALAIQTCRPVQATYLLTQGSTPSPKEMISTFAFKVKNLVRPLGMHRLRQPCLLTGSGMAFPWSVIQTMDLANGNLVEDMHLGLTLAIAGHPPIMCPDALVLGEQPQSSSVALTQRTRWEHGHLKTLLTSVPSLFWEGVKQRRLSLIAIALDISIPPLALLVSLWGTTAVIITMLTIFSRALLPLIMIYSAGFSLVTAIALSWHGFARTDIPMNKLIYIPIYILWKLPLYFNFLLNPEKKWIRTKRDKETSST